MSSVVQRDVGAPALGEQDKRARPFFLKYSAKWTLGSPLPALVMARTLLHGVHVLELAGGLLLTERTGKHVSLWVFCSSSQWSVTRWQKTTSWSSDAVCVPHGHRSVRCVLLWCTAVSVV